MVAGGQHSVVLLDEGENVLQLVYGFAVTGDDDARGGVFAVFAVVVLGGVGGQPDDLCAQLQRSFHRVGVQTAHRWFRHSPPNAVNFASGYFSAATRLTR